MQIPVDLKLKFLGPPEDEMVFHGLVAPGGVGYRDVDPGRRFLRPSGAIPSAADGRVVK
jgi:hypothetical protein